VRQAFLHKRGADKARPSSEALQRSGSLGTEWGPDAFAFGTAATSQRSVPSLGPVDEECVHLLAA